MFECGFLLLDECGSSFREIRNVISSSTKTLQLQASFDSGNLILVTASLGN